MSYSVDVMDLPKEILIEIFSNLDVSNLDVVAKGRVKDKKSDSPILLSKYYEYDSIFFFWLLTSRLIAVSD